ncbi:hypothetical protein TNCV_698081 [Trichonephila clavipes]|nr:hypothetical protein TNCV_698081 [Trichonephila clavipes]
MWKEALSTAHIEQKNDLEIFALPLLKRELLESRENVGGGKYKQTLFTICSTRFLEVGTIDKYSACVEVGTIDKHSACVEVGTIDKYSACVEVGTIDKNSACVEVGTIDKYSACVEDLIRVVEDLDGTVESTDTIVKLKTKIENSSTFESDPDFVKTLIKNCIDERVSRNERDLEKQKIELAKLHRRKQFKTLNKETATHIGIREAEDWFRPIDLAKECDIYISSRSGSRKEIPITYGYTQDPFKNRSQNFKPEIKENYPQYLERENKNCYICGDSSHYARDCEKRFKPKESNDHIHNRINVNTLKVESEKQKLR